MSIVIPGWGVNKIVHKSVRSLVCPEAQLGATVICVTAHIYVSLDTLGAVTAHAFP